MKKPNEIKSRLIEIKTEFEGFGHFSIHTMARVEDRAREVKVLVVDALGKDDQIFSELDKSIELSEKYHKKHYGLEYDMIRASLRHLEYALELFISRI